MKLKPFIPFSYSCLSLFGLVVHLGSTTHIPAVPKASNAYGSRVSMREPDVDGKVLILMYHHIGPVEKYMFRSNANFEHDLQRLYDMNYRPVTVQEYVENRMPIPPGASPVVFTFDDSHADQFHMLPDGTVDPDSFVGEWMQFAAKHPDFPVHCTFYLNDNGPWNQKEFLPQKLAMIKQWGCELGNHTATHPNLKKLNDDQVKKEIAEESDRIEALGFHPVSFCYPFGNEPKDMALVTNGFQYNGKTYKFSSATLAGSAPARAVADAKFDPYRIWRVQACPGVEGIDWWLDQVANNRSTPYVQP